jgi:acylpyruvate hydrolase
MRLVTFVPVEATDRHPPTLLGALLGDDRVVDLARLSAAAGGVDLPLTGMMTLLAAGPPALAGVRDLISVAPDAAAVRRLDEVQLQAPIPRPGKILCAGVNYRDHILVPGRSLPDEPSFFAKLPSVVIGAFDGIRHPGAPHTVDYEVEPACVIGMPGYRIPATRALQYVAGYTILNDVSARDVQFRNNQLTLGKKFDTFAPMGPFLATPDELGDPQDVQVRTFVNGDPRQHASTSCMVFDIPALIAWVSHVCTLEPGDVVSTGTPAGVGAFRQQPRFLENGDVVRMEIDGIRAIENRVISMPDEMHEPTLS